MNLLNTTHWSRYVRVNVYPKPHEGKGIDTYNKPEAALAANEQEESANNYI